MDDILIQQSDKQIKATNEVTETLEMGLVKQEETKKAIEGLAPIMKRVGSAAEFIEGFLGAIKGDKGDQGEKGENGDTPSDEDLTKLIKPLIPAPVPGKDGYTPVKGVDYFDGKDGQDGKPGKDGLDGESIVGPQGPKGDRGERGPAGSPDTGMQIVTKLRSLKGQERLSYDDLKDLPPPSPASKSIEIYDESGLIEGNLERINFTGAGVTAASDGHGSITVVITGGSGGAVYSETPTGAINGSNAVYTTAHDITTVFSFAIGGQFIHPEHYSIAGNQITLDAPLDASLSGMPFTIVYQ